jgi:hypothetical protein
MPEVIQYGNATPQDAEDVGRVVNQVRLWEEGIGRDFRLLCLKWYRQYRGFRKYRDAWQAAPEKDRDVLVYDAAKHWGAHLHIPMSFRTIETIVPRAIAQMPKLLVLPRDEQWIKNVEAIRLLLDAQQANINIDLAFQSVMRSGRIYGLGVGKSWWCREWRTRRRVERKMLGMGWTVGQPKQELTFDDPMFEPVDVFDFMWDPYGSDMRTIEWCVHRTWLSTKAIMERLQQDVWKTGSTEGLTEEEIRSLGGGAVQHYDEVWRERLLASGFTNVNFTRQGEQPHEILEFHDGDRVLTVLDRQVLVQDAENPCCGMMPFQIYRPTPLEKQFVGIGDLEPLEHLQRDLDTLRSQRRDAATIALNAGYAFDDGAIDEDDLTFGPGTAIRVTNGRPQDAIMPLPVKQVPGTAYQDEQVIRADFEGVSGLQDTLENGTNGGANTTATEAQLQHATLGQRILLSSRRFEQEVVREVARSFLYLDQRMILEERPPLRVPDGQLDELEAAETGRWKWFPIGPNELQGEYEIEPEGGSMAARNIPQDRQDAAQLINLFSKTWYINPTKPLLRALELMGIKHPQGWLRDPEPPIPAKTIDLLRLAGVDPTLLQQAVIRARTLSAPQEGPGGAVESVAPMAASQAPSAPSGGPYG